jgi:hypothetical protein
MVTIKVKGWRSGEWFTYKNVPHNVMEKINNLIFAEIKKDSAMLRKVKE